MRIKYILKRHPAFYLVRFWLIIKKSSTEDFEKEHCNKYVKPNRIPLQFKEEVERIGFNASDAAFDKAKKMILYMSEHFGKGEGLGYPTVEMLNVLKKKSLGVCSDYAVIFTALCIANDIKVREWGLVDSLAYKAMGKTLGHSFNEVYCKTWEKWVMFDPYYGIYFEDKRKGLPLSATELIDLQSQEKAQIKENLFLRINWPNATSKLKIKRLYYQNNVFFLLKDYDVFAQDKILSWHRLIPLPVLHFILILFNKYYKYVVYFNANNDQLMKRQLMSLFKFRPKPFNKATN